MLQFRTFWLNRPGILVRVNIVLRFQYFSFRGNNILYKWLEKYLFLHPSPFIKHENYLYCICLIFIVFLSLFNNKKYISLSSTNVTYTGYS
jgi:hypothetical protein